MLFFSMINVVTEILVIMIFIYVARYIGIDIEFIELVGELNFFNI